MDLKTGKEISAEAFYALPDSDVCYELVRGCLVAEPPPGALHGHVAAKIAALLHNYVRDGGRPGVVLTCDTWFELARVPATVRGPDVAFISLERYRSLKDVRRAVPGAPDLAVEVLSPSQRAKAMQAKVDDYIEAGATEVWVVDAVAMAVVVHRPGDTPLTLGPDDVLSTPRLLPGFSVRVRELIELPI